MKDKIHIQSFNEHQENLNISDVSDSDLITQIKKYKDELLQDNGLYKRTTYTRFIFKFE